MPRHIMGVAYVVEPNVMAVLRGFTRSTGFAGKKMVHLDMVKGTPHLFTPDILGETLTDIREGRFNTRFMVGEYTELSRCVKPSHIAEIDELPESVRSRYRLDGADFVVVSERPAVFWRVFPTLVW